MNYERLETNEVTNSCIERKASRMKVYFAGYVFLPHGFGWGLVCYAEEWQVRVIYIWPGVCVLSVVGVWVL
jgi:hypothetical protein